MLLRLGVIVCMILGLGGCATAAGKAPVNRVDELHQRIALLESQLEKRDREIDYLQDELFRLQTERPASVTDEKKAAALSVKQIQRALKNAGVYSGPIDGKAGSKTQEAIKTFQKMNGLNPDGVVGAKTEAQLKKYLKM